MSEVVSKATLAKKVTTEMSILSSKIKDHALEAMAIALEHNSDYIIKFNECDVNAAIKANRPDAFIDRLTLDQKRIKAMAEGLRIVKSLPDPVGEVIFANRRPNGLEISQRRVPIGVIGIIYESRPNVTADAVGLCIKTGNAVILRGGSEAINSNKAIASIMTKAAYQASIPLGAIQLIEDTKRKSAQELMKLNGLIDVLIPRGGTGLIKTVVEQATVPVIETGAGNCHVYVDAESDLQMALNIVINAKTHRPGVCNAAETLLVDSSIAHEFIPKIVKALKEKSVEIRGCSETISYASDIIVCTQDDWSTEYLDNIIAVKIVDDINEAISHINHYGTGHSEAIVTNNYFKAHKFQNEVDAAAVYVNASTRFTDGNEFGFGAEIGISTQKLHARGPMGLKELTTVKYIVNGSGQIRA